MNHGLVKDLKQIRLFDGIEENDIPHMLECIGSYEKKFRKTEFVSLEGEDLSQVGVLRSGIIHMIKEDLWGDRMLLATLTPGDIFGESFACNDIALSSVSFYAAADCIVEFLPFRRLLTTCENVCKFHQRLIENMVVMIATKNIQLMKKMEILSKKTIRERILVWISQQIQEYGNRRFTTTMGRVALAEFLCVDRSALTRELTNMEKDGILKFYQNTFELQ